MIYFSLRFSGFVIEQNSSPSDTKAQVNSQTVPNKIKLLDGNSPALPNSTMILFVDFFYIFLLIPKAMDR